MLHAIVRRGDPGWRLFPFALLTFLGLWSAPRAWAIDISSLPVTITTPGVYHVTQDLSFSSAFGIAILVNTDNVTVLLDGHTITGPGSQDSQSDAVDLEGDNCSVSGGTIQNFGDAVFIGTSSCSASGLTISHCFTGVVLDGDGEAASGNTITHCDFGVELDGNGETANGNTITDGGTGIFIGEVENTVSGNTCNNNSTGIEEDGGGCTITGNTAIGSAVVDLKSDLFKCDDDVWSDNCFGTASDPCIGTSVCASQVSITCPQSRTVNATFASPTSAIVEVGMPTTTPTGLPVVGVRADGKALTDPFPLGTTTLTWMVNPGQESAQTCMQSITINPPGAPTITCPGNQTVTAAAGQNSATVAVGMATTDAEGATIVGVRSDGKALTAPYPVGTTTITWMVTFDEQAPVTCTQTVTVQAAPSFPFIIRGPSEANPHIDSIFVDQGPLYQRAIIHGSGFADIQGTSYVTLGGHQITVLDWTDVAIGVLINPQAFNQGPLALNAAYPVQVVIKANGLKSNTVDFFLTDGPPPD
jgi:parallel beta-helix repeat protein